VEIHDLRRPVTASGYIRREQVSETESSGMSGSPITFVRGGTVYGTSVENGMCRKRLPLANHAARQQERRHEKTVPHGRRPETVTASWCSRSVMSRPLRSDA
jgi:hypothetical protein